jgi:DNA-(apurinic or apyrimidinic site) lyase
LKLKRLQKFEKFRTYKLNSLKKPNNFIQTYYKNLNILLEEISLTLNNKKNTKTVVFAIKMFGY